MVDTDVITVGEEPVLDLVAGISVAEGPVTAKWCEGLRSDKEVDWVKEGPEFGVEEELVGIHV